MRRVAVLLVLACFALRAAADDDAEMAAWHERLQQAESELARAEERPAAALAAYQDVRHRRRVRGEEKAQVIAERAEAEQAVAQAKDSLDSLREQARRSGVPPAWIYTDEASEPPPADDP